MLSIVGMDSHTDSAFGRLQIVETGRRGRWTDEEKRRVVLENMSGPRLVSETAVAMAYRGRCC